MSDWTHQALVERAGRWLLNTRRCKLVIIEAKPYSCDEHPDAVGWLPDGVSIVVECKLSLPDYRADYGKRWRKTSTGMGAYRYYMTPPGLLSEWGPPDGSGWLEAESRIVAVKREAPMRQIRDWSKELCLLLARVSKDGRTIIGNAVLETP